MAAFFEFVAAGGLFLVASIVCVRFALVGYLRSILAGREQPTIIDPAGRELRHVLLAVAGLLLLLLSILWGRV